MISTISRTIDVGREVLAALGALGDRELAEEVLVDLAEGVALDVAEDGVDRAQQADQRVVGQRLVGPGQDALQGRVLLLDRGHRVVDGLAEVVALLQLQEVREPGLLGQVEDALGLVVGLADLPAACAACPPAPPRPG